MNQKHKAKKRQIAKANNRKKMRAVAIHIVLPILARQAWEWLRDML